MFAVAMFDESVSVPVWISMVAPEAAVSSAVAMLTVAEASLPATAIAVVTSVPKVTVASLATVNVLLATFDETKMLSTPALDMSESFNVVIFNVVVPVVLSEIVFPSKLASSPAKVTFWLPVRLYVVAAPVTAYVAAAPLPDRFTV